MYTEEKRKELEELALKKDWLRFPRVNLNVSNEPAGCTIILETFVRDKDSNLIAYQFNRVNYNSFTWAKLEEARTYFENQVSKTQQYYIFNNTNAIIDPYPKPKVF